MTRLIDADAFIEENQDIIDCEIDHPKYQDTLRELIDHAPTVERPHREWKTEPHSMIIHCSNCDAIENLNRLYVSNFCYSCGVDMRVKNELNRVSKELNSEIEKQKIEICPCIECCKIDNSEPCRKGCSDYQKWKASEME